MGLSIVGSNSGASVRVGSYTGVHMLRAVIAILVARYFQAQGNEAGMNAALSYVPFDQDDDDIETMRLDWNGAISYAGVPERDNGADLSGPLAGLSAFVNHSDCDGTHTPGECVDIDAMFKCICPVKTEHLQPFITEEKEQGTFKEWVERIAAFYAEAAAHRDTVYFG